MLSANISPQFINNRLSGPSIDTSSRPLRVSLFFFFFKLNFEVILWCQNPCCENDFKQDAIRKFLIVKQETEYIDNRFFSVSLFPSIFERLPCGAFITEGHAIQAAYLKSSGAFIRQDALIWERVSIRSFTASELQVFLKGINLGRVCEMKSISCWLILLIKTVFWN